MISSKIDIPHGSFKYYFNENDVTTINDGDYIKFTTSKNKLNVSLIFTGKVKWIQAILGYGVFFSSGFINLTENYVPLDEIDDIISISSCDFDISDKDEKENKSIINLCNLLKSTLSKDKEEENNDTI